MSIYTKLHAVMKDCEYIQKDKEHPTQHYWYASEAAIKDKVHLALVKHGVLFLPHSITIKERVTGLGKDQGNALTVVRMEYMFVDTETGEKAPGVIEGTGVDPMDKGNYKAITGAIKYALTGTFLIPTGDDPEAEDVEPPKQYPTKEEKAVGKAAAQQVAQQKILESYPEPVRAILLRVKDQQSFFAEVSELQAKLVAAAGNRAKSINEHLLGEFEAKSVGHVTKEQMPKFVNRMWQEITSAEGLKQLEGHDQQLRALYSRLNGIKGTVEEFQNLKADLQGKLGEFEAEKVYYRVLEKHGVKSSNEFRGGEKPRQAARELYEIAHGIAEAS